MKSISEWSVEIHTDTYTPTISDRFRGGGKEDDDNDDWKET